MGSQQIFISFANFYRHFIQSFSRIATWLTAMLKTTRSSVASTFRVDDNEVVGGVDGARVESGGSVYQRVYQTFQVTLVQTYGLHQGTYSAADNQAGKTLERRPKGRFVARSRRLRRSPSRWVFRLHPYFGINNHAIELVNDHPSHPQVLPPFLTGSRTDAFDCAPEISITWPWRTDTRYLGLRLYPPGRSINSDRKKFAF